MRQWLTGTACVAAALMVSAQASAVVLLNDSFGDADRTDTNLPSESALYVSHPNNVTTSAGSVVFDLPSQSTMRGHTYFAAGGSPVQIGVGEQLIARFSFTSGTLINNTSRNFRMGLYNSPASQILVDGANDSGSVSGGPNNWAGAQGYAVFMPLTGAPGSTQQFQIGKRIAAAGNLMGSTGDYVQNSSGGGLYTASSDTQYQLEMILDRTGATTMNVTVNLYEVGNGTPVATQTILDDAANFGNQANATNPYLSFDMLAFRFSGSGAAVGDDITFTNLYVELVPEPASLGLLSLAGLALAARRRRA